MDLYVINLAERTDRLHKIKQRFKGFNIIRVDAIKHEVGWKGCYMSFLKCIQHAKDNNMPYICVLEDDCEPFEGVNIYEKLMNIKEYLDNNEWQLFIGGGSGILEESIVKKIDFDKEKLYLVNYIKCMHMAFFHKSVYDFFLNSEINTHIDIMWHGKIQAVVPIPYIASQSKGYSDIEKRFIGPRRKIYGFNDRLVKYVNDPKNNLL